ncbi:DUF2059 domain-containing protein [Antarcticimicrobium sediminis]|uniref:DUF2059 domain-containing protein n=1 Tax=Antarcticimicrobium sediminis TaxID=2546227 RepID=A0A4R5EIZ6_9RHOB|nr:DUF2059 domain-containing protein [Antarcticimicrobium sediminis]TDE34521.1 DUF2059 domain-containing protein [Antarcticimicrobium sediminis]
MTDTDTRPFRALIPPLRWLFGLLILFAGLASFAAPTRAAERGRIEAFLQVTGFDVALDSIAFSAGAAPKMLGIEPGLFGSEWERLSKEVFDTAEMQGLGLDILEPTLRDEALNHAAEFYASDLGQRLVAAENHSQRLEDDSAKQAEGKQILADLRDSDPGRIKALERMNGSIDAAGASLRAMQEIQFRFLMAASAAGVVELRTDADELRALLKQNEAELREAIRASALAGSAFTYRDFTDEEIVAYTEALDHPLMQEVYELLNATQYEIMANRFEVLAARMAELRPGQDI